MLYTLTCLKENCNRGWREKEALWGKIYQMLDWGKSREDCWIGGRELKIVGLVDRWKSREGCWIGGRELSRNCNDPGQRTPSYFFSQLKSFYISFFRSTQVAPFTLPSSNCCWEFEDKTREWRLSRRSKPCGFCIYLPKILTFFCLDKIDRDEQRW